MPDLALLQDAHVAIAALFTHSGEWQAPAWLMHSVPAQQLLGGSCIAGTTAQATSSSSSSSDSTSEAEEAQADAYSNTSTSSDEERTRQQVKLALTRACQWRPPLSLEALGRDRSLIRMLPQCRTQLLLRTRLSRG